MNIHGYIGLIATLPIFIESTYKFTQTHQTGYLWLISFALFLAASFIIFRLPPKVRTDNYQLLYKNKFRIGAVLLLIANTSQYIAGITLGVSMFSIASICFVISMILLYFCKPYNSN